jgi:hypothetical protein
MNNEITTGQNWMANVLRLAAEFDQKRQRVLAGTDDMKNATGETLPSEAVKERYIRKSKIVEICHLEAEFVRELLRQLRTEVYESVDDHLDYLAAEYGMDRRNEKGNYTISSFDNEKKVEVRVQEKLEFGEEIQLAKEKIDRCIRRWSKGSNANLRKIVNNAFRVDQTGAVDRNRILALRDIDIDDPDWKEAMNLIADALHVTGTKSYVRFRHRVGEEKKWETIPINIAKV